MYSISLLMVNNKRTDSLIKIDSEILEHVRKVVEDNHIIFPSMKYFTQQAILSKLKSFREKEVPLREKE